MRAGKTSNAGGVATSGLEMSQNAMRLNWSRDEMDERLHDIMRDIHAACLQYGRHTRRALYFAFALASKRSEKLVMRDLFLPKS